MRTSGNTVLITGGATGIGFALAKAFAAAGNRVIICGRREHKLREAKQLVPGLEFTVCDVSKEEQRAALCRWVEENFGGINILVNNAGIQRKIDFRKGAADVLNIEEEEIAINLIAPIAITAYFVPLLSRKESSAVVTITSGLGFVPLAVFPIYSATKAALHSFCVSLRHQLRGTTVKVFEAICSTTETELKTAVGNEQRKGMQAADVAREIMAAIASDNFEVTIGEEARSIKEGALKNPEQTFQRMNGR